MDFTLLFGYYYFLDDLILWHTAHFVWAGIILIILNILTAAWGVFTFFSIYTAEHEIKGYSSFISTGHGAVIGISALLIFVSMMWWLIPTQAINTIDGFPIYNGLTALVYFLTTLGVLSKAMNNSKYYNFSKSKAVSLTSALLNGSFFFFSYGILITSMQIWNPGEFQYHFYGILCLVLFYLPLRIFLLLRPPFHKVELISVIISFGIMIQKLFL